jgi:hypothetical protein
MIVISLTMTHGAKNYERYSNNPISNYVPGTSTSTSVKQAHDSTWYSVPGTGRALLVTGATTSSVELSSHIVGAVLRYEPFYICE